MEKFSVGSFENYLTWEALAKGVAGELRKAAEIEFSTISWGSEVDGSEIHDIRAQAEVMKAFTSAYIDGLAEMYCTFACQFSGDRSAQEELHAKFGGSGNKLWNRSLKNIGKTLRKLAPKRIVFNRG